MAAITTSVPRNCLLPVIPHSCIKGDGHICRDRGAALSDSDLSALNTVAFSFWILRVVKGPVSRQCHNESVSTLRPRSYAGRYSSMLTINLFATERLSLNL